MTPSFQDRWVAAQNAEDMARRREASTLMSGVVMLIFLSILALWLSILSGRI